MKLRNATWLLALAAGLACCSMNPDRPLGAQESEVLVMVVNKGNTGAAGMNLAEARKLLLGETSGWRNGTKVLVVLSPGGSTDRATVLKRICGMSEAAYIRYEMQASFTGQTAASINVAASDSAVKATVKANPGAVGFLHKGQVDGTVQAVLELN
jgi:ABC-type phosphate transport system substrate-binding protein